MKLLYATSITYPSDLANRIQTMEMSEEFNKQLDFDNFILGGKSIILKNENGINIKNISGSTKSYFLAWKYLLLARQKRITHIFCREEKLLFFILLYNKLFFHLSLKFIYEAHFVRDKNNFWYSFLLNKCDYIIVVNFLIKKELVEKKSVIKNKILVNPNGVDFKKFDIQISKEEAREKLNLSLNKIIVLYTGHLYDWKGAQVLADASKFLEKDVIIVFVGGMKRDLINFKEKNKKYHNILILGQKSHSDIPIYLKSADILLVPNIPISQESMNYTSPIKIFEYMSSKRPIIASDLPSIREILNKNNAVLIESNNPEKLSQAIEKILSDQDLRDKISENAYRDVKHYTWRKRVKNILEFTNYIL